MHHNITTLKQVLNPAYRKQNPKREEIDCFKNELNSLIANINAEETEEHNKNLLMNFLNDVYYRNNHYINTKDRADLVIHNGKDSKTSVGVLIEVKKPTNKTEMVSRENLNVKSFQELVLYYLRERKTKHNFELRHLIITNTYEWFLFDAQDFEKLFYQNKSLLKHFEEFEAGKLSGTTTDFFYKEIASPIIQKLQTEIPYTHFDIRDYETSIRNTNKEDDRKLIALYKLLSPVHLLKLPFANDNNQLNKNFYAELLHIIGLEEIVQDGKKLIVRKKESARDSGSIIENAMEKIVDKNKMENVNAESFGKTKEEQLFGVSLDLAITWINRILFLKLLESQILKYHNGNKDHAFLSAQKLSHYNDLDNLFFKVLALKEEERDATNKAKFAHVPYLNSSLFEITDTEEKTICIDSLPDNIQMALYPKSVLYERGGSTGDPCGRPTMRPLEYLLKFLDAYDFSSEGSEDIQEENKPLISASVLGLIFEKINGYKDGSFFTPSFITMYMCRETISRAVIQKFNEIKQWNCETIDQLYNKIENLEEANTIFNSIRICDPAVGSGHFLVSALNEMIYLKSELGILLYKNSERKLKDYRVTVENDELIITDNEGNYFHYNPKDTESQKVQESFFHEKQILIEKCLFGVDINPNSVKICQLRLWIELLKHTYYIIENGELRMENEEKVSPAGGGLRGWKQMENRKLQTLPNIDINIRCGNSLISRFDLHDKYLDVQGLMQKVKQATKKYKEQVFLYKLCKDREKKRHIVKNIEHEKSIIYEILNFKDSDFRKWQDAKDKSARHLYADLNFGDDKEQWKKIDIELTAEETVLREKYEQKTKGLYKDAFEWRFEFPEVLDDDGNFVGFDVVIGNPPYITMSLGKKQKIFSDTQIAKYKELYDDVFEYKANMFAFFISKGKDLIKNGGVLSYIIPNTLLLNSTFSKSRKFLLEETQLLSLINLNFKVFESAEIGGNLILEFNTLEKEQKMIKCSSIESFEMLKNLPIVNISPNEFIKDKEYGFNFNKNDLLTKMEDNSMPLGEIVTIYQGIITGDNTKFLSKEKSDDRYFPILRGKNIYRYSYSFDNDYILFDKEQLWSNTNEELFHTSEKLINRQTGDSLIATYDDKQFFTLDSTHIQVLKNQNFNIKYLLALFNSKLINYWYKINICETGRVFAQVKAIQLKKIPIPNISLSEQQPIIALVDKILSAKKENPAADTAELEREIDLLVYGLYGLNQEEICIIEK